MEEENKKLLSIGHGLGIVLTHLKGAYTQAWLVGQELHVCLELKVPHALLSSSNTGEVWEL